MSSSDDRKNTHARLNKELADRLRGVSEALCVPLTRLLDHIVADALPVYEQQIALHKPIGLVPGFNDPRSPTDIAKAAAQEALDAAIQVRRRAKVALAWDEIGKAAPYAQPRGASARAKRARCPHPPERVKVLSWGGRICQDCGQPLKARQET